jgi:uncharacterized protein YaiI (UPF0178 family)
MSFTIWLDGDACPRTIKEIVFKASIRTETPTVVVANSLQRVLKSAVISCVVVSQAFDAADSYIVTHCQPGDLVITADIPLADLVIGKQGTALNPRGKIYTASNIKDQLSMRNLMTEFRGGLASTGGPKEFGAADIKTFSAAFDRLLHAGIRSRSPRS